MTEKKYFCNVCRDQVHSIEDQGNPNLIPKYNPGYGIKFVASQDHIQLGASAVFMAEFPTHICEKCAVAIGKEFN